MMYNCEAVYGASKAEFGSIGTDLKSRKDGFVLKRRSIQIY